MNGFLHAVQGFAEGQRIFAAEEEAFVHFAAPGCGEFKVDAELADFFQAVAQAAHGEAVDALGAAALVGLGIGLQHAFALHIAFEKFGFHAAGGPAGPRHDFHHLLGVGTRQAFLEVDVGISLLGDGNSGAGFHGLFSPFF